MKRWTKFLALILTLALFCAVAQAAEDYPGYWEDRYINNWIVAEYEVGTDEIYKDDIVDLQVRLYNAADVDEDGLKIAAETSSFNGIDDIQYDSIEDGYLWVTFENARYTGVGNTFMMRVDGEVLTLTVHECVPEDSVPQPGQDQTAPVLQVGRYDQLAPISKGVSQTVTVWIHNPSMYHLTDVSATVTASADLMITDNSLTHLIGTIWSGHTGFFDVTLLAPGEISSAAQALTIDVNYTYEKDDVLVQSSQSHTVPLSASTGGSAASGSVPNVIISSYSYGDDKVMAGQSFDLALEFKNTAASNVENVVMTIEPGDGLAITSSANSFHYPVLGGGAVQTQTINLQALPDAATGPANIKIGFSYEYMDGQTRNTAAISQTVSLPVYQLDRFELSQNLSYLDAWQYEECFLSLSYLNKGKGTVYNVSAEILGEITALEKVQHIGNVESGRSGSIDFIVTPDQVGQTQVTVQITYEDEAMQVMTKEFTFDLMVNEAFVPEFMEEPMMPEVPVEEDGFPWTMVALIAVGVAVVALVVIVVIRKKKKNANVVHSFVFDDGAEAEEDIHAPS